MAQSSQATCLYQSRTPCPRIFDRKLEDSAPERGSTMMLGNFDGFHLGHQALARKARSLSRGRPVGMMSCEPHPRSYFRTEATPFRLVTPRSKARTLMGAGVDFVYQPRFDAAFAGQTPEEFVEKVLVDSLGVSHVVTGPDFRFGSKREGDVSILRELGKFHNFSVSTTNKLSCDGSQISSSRIRDCLRSGNIEEALHLLGGTWIIEVYREADGRLRMHEMLCQPAPGRFKADMFLSTNTNMDLELEIFASGQVLPLGPVPNAARYFFQIKSKAT